MLDVARVGAHQTAVDGVVEERPCARSTAVQVRGRSLVPCQGRWRRGGPRSAAERRGRCVKGLGLAAAGEPQRGGDPWPLTVADVVLGVLEWLPLVVVDASRRWRWTLSWQPPIKQLRHDVSRHRHYYALPVEGAPSDAAVRPTVCLSRDLSSKTAHFIGCEYCRTLMWNPMLEVKPTGQRARSVDEMATRPLPVSIHTCRVKWRHRIYDYKTIAISSV